MDKKQFIKEGLLITRRAIKIAEKQSVKLYVEFRLNNENVSDGHDFCLTHYCNDYKFRNRQITAYAFRDDPFAEIKSFLDRLEKDKTALII